MPRLGVRCVALAPRMSPGPVHVTGWPVMSSTQGAQMRNPQMKIAQAFAGLLLVAGGVAACGDNGGDSSGGGAAPDKAKSVSTDDFCGAFQAFADDISGLT